MKVAVFWDVAPCSLADMDSITLMMEAVSSCETLDSIYYTAWCSIPEDSHLQCSTWDNGMDLDIFNVRK
jgi:hypothetical protein